MDLPGEKLVIRLWETIERGGVGLFRPWQLRRVGLAEAEVAAKRAVLIAEAEAEAKGILAGGGRSLPVPAPALPQPHALATNDRSQPSSMEQLAAASQRRDFLRKELNVERAIECAERVLGNSEDDPPDAEVDVDWYFRWRESAGAVSNDDLRQIWGNVLAGEVKAPGTFTLRTLDFLRNLSASEAHLIERMASKLVDEDKLYYGRGFTFKAKLPIVKLQTQLGAHEMILLEELGVVGGVGSMGYTDDRKPAPLNGGEFGLFMTARARALVAITEDEERKTDLSFYRLTSLGRSVLRLVEAVADEAHLREIGQVLIASGFKVVLGDFVKTETTIGVENEVELGADPSA